MNVREFRSNSAFPGPRRLSCTADKIAMGARTRWYRGYHFWRMLRKGRGMLLDDHQRAMVDDVAEITNRIEHA